MYGRGQLCKLNDSSINNEIHERQRRQDAPVRRRRLLVPTTPWRDGRGAGAAPRQPWRGSAGGVSPGEGSSGSWAFLGSFPWMLSLSQSSGAGEPLSGPTLRTGRSRSQPTLPLLPSGQTQPPLRSHQFGLVQGALVPLFRAWASPESEMVKSQQFAA